MDGEARRLGRPPIEEGRLDHRVNVPVTRDDWERWRHEAAAAGYPSLAAYLRDRLSAAPVAPRRELVPGAPVGVSRGGSAA